MVASIATILGLHFCPGVAGGGPDPTVIVVVAEAVAILASDIDNLEVDCAVAVGAFLPLRSDWRQ